MYVNGRVYKKIFDKAITVATNFNIRLPTLKVEKSHQVNINN